MDISKEISIIFQGPYLDGITDKCLEITRNAIPNSEIIFSTWLDSNCNSTQVDLLLENKDPGGEYYCDFPKIIYSANRQIVSTLAGLKKATRKYAIKIRSDMYLENYSFFDYFNMFDKRSNDLKLLKERVVISSLNSINPKKYYQMPFHPTDWFFFGLKTDLLDIFDISLCPEPETSRWFESHDFPKNARDQNCFCRYRVEQYIWITFLKKHIPLEFDNGFDISHNNIRKSEMIFANNTIIVDPIRLGYNSLKHLNHRDRITFQEANYSFYEWKILYKKYCDQHYKIPVLDIDAINELKNIIIAKNNLTTIFKLLKSFLKYNIFIKKSMDSKIDNHNEK